VREAVERAIETETEGPERERLFVELNERLTERDDALALTGPGGYEALIVQICKELGLSKERRRSSQGPAYAKAAAGGGAAPVGSSPWGGGGESPLRRFATAPPEGEQLKGA